MAVMSTVFGTVGTAGQRCTSTRRIIVHEDIYDDVRDKFVSAYKKKSSLKLEILLNEDFLVGPLIDGGSVELFSAAVKSVEEEGGKVLFGGQVLDGEGFESGNYVVPCNC